MSGSRGARAWLGAEAYPLIVIECTTNRSIWVLMPLPLAVSFRWAWGIIEGWRRAGAFASDAIPSESILSEQLGRITDEDLRDNPEMRFHAINAFRYVVGGFEKNRWRPASGKCRGRRRDGRSHLVEAFFAVLFIDSHQVRKMH